MEITIAKGEGRLGLNGIMLKTQQHQGVQNWGRVAGQANTAVVEPL